MTPAVGRALTSRRDDLEEIARTRDHATAKASDGSIDDLDLARNLAVVGAVAKRRGFRFELHREEQAFAQIVHFPGRAAASES